MEVAITSQYAIRQWEVGQRGRERDGERDCEITPGGKPARREPRGAGLLRRRD